VSSITAEDQQPNNQATSPIIHSGRRAAMSEMRPTPSFRVRKAAPESQTLGEKARNLAEQVTNGEMAEDED
jgi:hypothetical protein